MTALARHLEVRRGVPARDMDPAPSLMRACLAQGVVDGCDKIVMPVELDPITRRIKSAVGCDEMVMPAEEHQASRYVQMGLARLGSVRVLSSDMPFPAVLMRLPRTR